MRPLLLTLLVACAPRQAPLQAPTAGPALVITAASRVDSRAVAPGPDALAQDLVDALTARGLATTILPGSAYTAIFATQRTTAHRLRHLAADAADGPLLVLLEATPRFDAQLNGRFRWVVAVTLSLAPSDDLAAAATESFDVPVFLSFHHERGPEALAAAGPVVQRHLGRMLDGYLGGL